MDRELIVSDGKFLVRCLKSNREITCPSLDEAVDYLIGLKYIPLPVDTSVKEGKRHVR